MPFWALPIWTLLVWATRIRNVADQDGVGASLVVPVVMTLLAVAALVDRRRALWLLVGATIALWAVRLPFVLLHHHSVPFKVVHAVLAIVSIALAILSRPRSSAPRPRRWSVRA
jgi:NADH:ubiquinone oxidoreductase subunit K